MAVKKQGAYKHTQGNVTFAQMKRLVGFADSSYSEVSAEMGVDRSYLPRKVNEDLCRREEEEERIFKETGRREEVPSENATDALDSKFEPIVVKHVIEDPGFWDALDFVLCRALRLKMLAPAVADTLKHSAFMQLLKSPGFEMEKSHLAALLGAATPSATAKSGTDLPEDQGVAAFLSFLSENRIDPEQAASLCLSPRDGRKVREWLAAHHLDFGAFASHVTELGEIMKLMKRNGITIADLSKAGAAGMGREEPAQDDSGQGQG